MSGFVPYLAVVPSAQIVVTTVTMAIAQSPRSRPTFPARSSTWLGARSFS